MKPLRTKFLNLIREIALEINYLPYYFKDNLTLKDPKKFLLIADIAIGDLIAITPSIKAINEQFPNALIDIILPPSMKDVLNLNPRINHIYEINRQDYFSHLAEIKKENYNVAIIFFEGDKHTSNFIKQANIPLRVGCAKVGIKNGKGYYLTRKTKPVHKDKHYIFYNLDVLRTLNIYPKEIKQEIFVDKETLAKYKRIMASGLKVAIHPIPNHPNHNWDKKRFAQVADYLIEKKKAKVFFTGSDKDSEEINEILTLMNHKAVNLTTKLIKDFFAIIKNSDLVISVDTSAMHVASAFNIPIIALMGPGPFKLWKPYSRKAISLFHPEVCSECRFYNCFRKGRRNMECMKAIKVEEVINSINRIIS